MRTRLLSVTAALALASATVASAQTPAAPQAGATLPPSAPIVGIIDFGGLFNSTDGDEARFERYRDDRDGLYTDINFSREGAGYFASVTANHIGYRDQRYSVGIDSQKVKFSFLFDSIPTNYLYGAVTPWTRNGETLTLNDAAQQAVQNRQVNGVPCAYATTCNNPTNAAIALSRRSVYNEDAPEFSLRTKRETLALGGTYYATRDVGVNLAFTSTGKKGEQPWGASFAFNNANEVPAPVDNRTNDFSAGVEWAKPKGMIRVAWDGSWFSNDAKTLVWDNPLRLTDFSNGLVPPSGPYDASGYSNGNGPAQGRQALWPNNSQSVISGTGLYKLARATSVNGTLQFTSQEQNEALIPWTINPVINSPVVFSAFPHLASLPRNSAEAKAQGVNALLNFTTRPFSRLSFQARYRYNDRDVQTPAFDATEYVRFDAVPEEIEEGISHQYDVTRQNFDANATFSLFTYGAIRVGYGHEGFERHGRGFSDVGDNIFRLSYDAMGLSFVTIRAAFDISRRRGEGFVEQGLDYEEGPGGTQPGLRYYDEADRDRTRGSIVVSANPTDQIAVYFQFAGGKDEFLPDDSIPPGREQFGLLDQSFTSWNIGVSASPNDTVSVGVNYGRDDFSALQKSRNANPPPDASWTDPNRNWFLDNDEAVNNFNLWMDVSNLRGAGIRLAYDFSDSDNALVHSGPRIDSLRAAGTFVALPDVTNSWHRFTADVKYFFASNVGVGVGYYYEKLDVYDFATIDANGSVAFQNATGTPRLDYLGELLTGYMARPYNGSSFFARLLYRF